MKGLVESDRRIKGKPSEVLRSALSPAWHLRRRIAAVATLAVLLPGCGGTKSTESSRLASKPPSSATPATPVTPGNLTSEKTQHAEKPRQEQPRLKLTGKRVTLQACDAAGATGEPGGQCNEKFSIGIPVGWKEAPLVSQLRRELVAAYGKRAALLSGTLFVRSNTKASEQQPHPLVYVGGGSGNGSSLKLDNPNLTCDDLTVEWRRTLPESEITFDDANVTVGGEAACEAAGDIAAGNPMMASLSRGQSVGSVASRMLMFVHDASVYNLSATDRGSKLSPAATDALEAIRQSWRWEGR